ncbi:MAG: hypothetical protein H8D32_01115 [Dehalococcoidia bacterium]|nr:hypothetical protein [Dehalococcoidia bacterium]
MSIKTCPNCKGIGWLPGSEELAAPQWERCWCSYGRIAKGLPTFWKDKQKIEQVFFCSYEDLEKAVSNFLNHIEPDPDQIKFLKFYVAQWVIEDPQPPLGWLERLAECADWRSLNDFTRWLEAHEIMPFGLPLRQTKEENQDGGRQSPRTTIAFT